MKINGAMLEIYMLTEDGPIPATIDDAIEDGVPQEVLEDVIFNRQSKEYWFKDGDRRADYYAAGYRFTWK